MSDTKPHWSKTWREDGKLKPGNKGHYARRAIGNRFGLTRKQAKEAPVAQIVRMDDVPAIRVLLGIGRKAARGESWPVPNLNLGGNRSYDVGPWLRRNGYEAAD